MLTCNFPFADTNAKTKQSRRTSLPFNALACIAYSPFSWILDLGLLALSRSLFLSNTYSIYILNPSLSSRSRLFVLSDIYRNLSWMLLN
ncbi:hypothetical protein FIBSPDRAFT_481041 [Athelia psychrophila]|uniref:Uncharacterized protein n=1 Tax=Athelia psychrophila TaxID=1759441 RepID=A0A166VF40_9AGAM|nr:hypothetical protein FIBSPDRAFT_481041 [Fibularhizoctonia sp. CBS 109695]